MSKPSSFGQVLLEAIDDSLQILGEEPKLALYQYLSTMQSLERKDIPERLGDFQTGLKTALGGAARVVERLILRRLYQKVGSSFRETSEYDFAEHVTEAKRRFDAGRLRQPQPPRDSEAPLKSKKGQAAG